MQLRDAFPNLSKPDAIPWLNEVVAPCYAGTLIHAMPTTRYPTFPTDAPHRSLITS